MKHRKLLQTLGVVVAFTLTVSAAAQAPYPAKPIRFITQIGQAQNLLVTHPSFPPKSVQELIAYSKQRPGQVNYGSSGIGTSVHLSAELFQYMAGVKWLQGLGAEIVASTPQQYAAYVREEIAKWAKVIKAAGIKSQ